jgi:hypothetical protein
MSVGKSLLGGHLQSVVYYGIAVCAAAGTGTFLWRQSTRLDKEPPPIVATSPATAPITETKATKPEPEGEPFWAKAMAEQTAHAKAAGKAAYNARGDKGGAPVRGQIAVSGKAGKFTAVAPATVEDYQSGPYVPERSTPVATSNPAPAGQQFYTYEEPADVRAKRAEEARKAEEERRRQKQEEDADSKWQTRTQYK